jgi:hypothetical protein
MADFSHIKSAFAKRSMTPKYISFSAATLWPRSRLGQDFQANPGRFMSTRPFVTLLLLLPLAGRYRMSATGRRRMFRAQNWLVLGSIASRGIQKPAQHRLKTKNGKDCQFVAHS